MTPSKPTQAPNLDVHEVEDGYVVYAETEQRVHYLNATAVLVLELCTGNNTEEEVGQLVATAFELSEVPSAEVAECLATLRRERLIVG